MKHYHKELKVYHTFNSWLLQPVHAEHMESDATFQTHAMVSCTGWHKVVLLHVECFCISACTRWTTVTTDHVYFNSTYMSWSYHSILPTHVSGQITQNAIPWAGQHPTEQNATSILLTQTKDDRGTTFWHEHSIWSHWKDSCSKSGAIPSVNWPAMHVQLPGMPLAVLPVQYQHRPNQVLVLTLIASQDRQPIAGQTCSQTW